MQDGTTVEVARVCGEALASWGGFASADDVRSFLEAVPDPPRRAASAVFFAFHATERGDAQLAGALLEQAVAAEPASASWAACCHAFLEMRARRYDEALRRLASIPPGALEADRTLAGYSHNVRASVLMKRGRSSFDEVHAECDRAWELLGPDGFAAGRVLDTLGQLYAHAGEHGSAQRLLRRSLELKAKFADTAGLAIAHGSLGRLALTCGDLDAARFHFLRDWELSTQTRDTWGAALMLGQLGRVDVLAGRWSDGLRWLDDAVRAAEAGNWPVLAAFARKDRAIAHAAAGRFDDAAADIAAARSGAGSEHDAAETDLAEAELLRRTGRGADAELLVRRAIGRFDALSNASGSARARRLLAGILATSGTSRELVARAWTAAWDAAAAARSEHLVAAIESEMRAWDRVAWLEHVYRRTRGCPAEGDTTSLADQRITDMTALFLDIVGSSDLGRRNPPEDVVATVNDLNAHFAPALASDGLVISAFLGDGFLALATGRDHAVRAVRAAIGLHAALARFNRPRRILGLPAVSIRVGCNSGAAALGNVGTYGKIDRTAVGHVVNMAKRVESNATETHPAIGAGCHALVSESFRFADPQGRTAEFKGGGPGPHRVWDVLGPASPVGA